MVQSTQYIDAVLVKLRETWARNPHLRLGQLVVIGTKPKNACTEVFCVEDEQLLKGLGEYANRQQEA